ncbi:GNAT family N-acetyltransferase [Nonomuraea angiospora]|uniref:GNAT family N-acetyltransferase n=1 Tax=Nonomuraea angiospora TaxID=46172 RepID=UPI0033D940C1
MTSLAWDHGPHIRIRQAAPADLPVIRDLAPQAGEGVELEEPLADAVAEEHAGAGLLVGIHESVSAFHGMTLSLLERSSSPIPAYMKSALVLVAEHDREGVVGTLLAYPPPRLVEPFRELAVMRGVSPLAGIVDLVKVKSLVVAESARGGRVGSELLRRCRQVFFGCGYRLMYGQIEPTAPDLENFYRKRGFAVLGAEESIPLQSVFGFNAHLHAEDGQRLFMREKIA